LTPGGFGIQIFGFGDTIVPRGHVERVALNLISHGHQVAQLKFRAGARAMLQREKIPFGLVWRRT
jgi:hypothetical protein